MTVSSYKPLKVLVRRMYPDFVFENYPKIITFTEKVFEYMDQQGNQYDIVKNLLEYTDVDTTLTKFEETFKKQYLANFPDSLASDVALLIKNIRSFYLSKGTEQSFRFLFAALFNSPVNFKYPKRNIFRASDGLWFTPTFIVISGDGPDFDSGGNIPPLESDWPNDVWPIERLVENFITGATSGAVAFVDNTVVLGNESPPLDYQNDPSIKAISITEKEGSFLSGEQILIGDTLVNNGDFSSGLLSWSLQPEGDVGITADTNELTIEQFFGVIQPKYVYQEIPVIENTKYWLRYSLNSATSAESRVTVGYAPGTSELYTSLNLGTSPITPPPTLLLPVAPGKKVFYISIYNEMTNPGDNCVFDGISIVPQDLSGAPLLYIANFVDIDLDPVKEPGIITGASQYKDNKGFLSEGDFNADIEIVLADGDYYQDFSYELTSQVDKSRYERIIKDLIHPAGMKLFSAVVPQDTVNNTFSFREFYYDDLVFTTGPDNISTASEPFSGHWRSRDIISARAAYSGDDVNFLNTKSWLVDTITATDIGTITGSIAADTPAFPIKLWSGMGIIDLDSMGEAIDIEYIIYIPLIVEQLQEDEIEFDIDYNMRLGFGLTWQQMELEREARGILIGAWDYILVGDFDAYATQRFLFIDSFEVDIQYVAPDLMLLETGDFFLLETGDNLVL